MKIGIIGSTGLIGSRVIELLKNSYEFKEFNSSSGTDITNIESLQIIAQDSEIEWVILLAAKADVDGCEADKELGEEGDAWKINVIGAKNVADICRETGKKLIYISSDFVFDGKKSVEEAYSEEDEPNPINWYGYTKWKGEQSVQDSGAEYTIVRLAYPYRAEFEQKKDFMRAIKSRLESGQSVTAVADHIFAPTYIDDFTQAIEIIISQDLRNIYHVVGNKFYTPYDAALLIADEFELDKNLISSITREVYFHDKAERPFNLSLNNDKIRALGVRMRSFEEGLQAVKDQLENSKF